MELLKEINRYREMEYNYKIENGLELGKVEVKKGKFVELQHKTLLEIIKEDFELEIREQNILPSSYINSQNKKQPMYILPLEYCKLILMRESNFVRRGVLKYIYKLENELRNKQIEYERVQVPTMTDEELEFRKEELKLRKLELLKDVRDNVRVDSYKDILNSVIVKETIGEMYLPLPKIEQLSYSATEICKMLKDRYNIEITINKLGRIANKENLKVDDNGVWVLDKKKYSNGTTETFRYYEKMVEVFYKLLKGEK